MIELKVGDKVEVMSNFFHNCKKGEIGTVVSIVTLFGGIVSVRFDNYSSGRHDCGGLCEYGHGRFLT